MGSLPLLQGIFPTQESKRARLHCRQNYPTFHRLFENIVSHQIQHMSPYYVHATGMEKRILFDLQTQPNGYDWEGSDLQNKRADR